jgi:hypothetical protein
MPLNTHEEFRQLCAIATSGCLTAEEQERLETHLVQCDGCRKALREYDRVARMGIPSLAEDFPADVFSSDFADDCEDWSEEAACQEFFERLDPAAKGGSAGRDSRDRQYGSIVREIGLQSPRGKVWMWPAASALPYAAAVLIAAGVGWLGYRAGIERGAGVARAVNQAPALRPGATIGPATFSKERQSLEGQSLGGQVEERDRAIARLTDKVARQTAEVEKLVQERKDLNDSLQKAQTERDQKVSERGALGHSLADSQAELARVKNDLDALQKQRLGDAAHDAEVAARLAKFADQLKERDANIDEQRDLLARDKDIRDLMGARELYVAEVSDVAGNGKTKKPFGRVFYTKGKSLIFYAYDLDQQPGLRNASTFQAWGRRGPELSQAVSLGIFYADNAAHKRWVLKFNDATSLAQIDAAFVTVEPNGGSQKPTGKPLLFAYLRVEPNHP